MLAEELGIRLNGGLLIRTKVRLVIVEIDVLHALAEEILFRRRRSGDDRRRRLGDGKAPGGVLRSAGTLGGGVIGGGSGGAPLLRSVGLNRANTVDGNVGGVRGLPGQSGGLAKLDCIGADGDGSRRGWGGRGGWRWRRRCLLLAGSEHHDRAEGDDGGDRLEGGTFHINPFHF